MSDDDRIRTEYARWCDLHRRCAVKSTADWWLYQKAMRDYWALLERERAA